MSIMLDGFSLCKEMVLIMITFLLSFLSALDGRNAAR